MRGSGAISAGLHLALSILVVLTASVAADGQPTLVADFDGDGTVNQADLIQLLQHVPSLRGETRYSIPHDLNVDGAIDHRDVFAFVSRWHGSPAPRTEVSLGEFLSRLGLADIEGDSFRIQCAPGGTPDVICSEGMTVSFEALEDFDGIPVRPGNLRLDSGGGAWRALASTQGGFRLMQIEVTEPLGGAISLPTQTISLSDPILMAPATVQSGVPFTDQGTAEVEIGISFSSAKPLFTLQMTVPFSGEGEWIDCSPNGDWSYACFIGEGVCEFPTLQLTGRMTLLFGPNGLLSVDVSYEFGGTGESFVGVTVPPPPGVDLDLTLTSPSPHPFKVFGSGLAVSEDLLFVLERYSYATTPVNSSVYAYDPDSPTPSLQHTYLPPEPQDVDLQFGSGIAPAGKNVLIGSSFSSGYATGAGAAYLFNADPSSPEFGDLVLRLVKPFPQEYERFGAAVAAAGNTLVVTAAPFGNPPPIPGSAYLFDGSPESSTFGDLLAVFAAPEPSTSDSFGAAAAVTEKGTVFVSGPLTIVDATVTAGVVHAFDADPLSPTYKEFLGTLSPPEPKQGGQFGFNLEAVGDILAVGSLFTGTVELFDADRESPGFLSHLKTLRPPSGTSSSFGYAIAAAGARLVVGELGYQSGGTGTGAVHLYDLDPNASDFGGFLLTLPNPAPESVTQFGLVVGGGANRFAVASRFVAGAGADTVFLFTIAEP